MERIQFLEDALGIQPGLELLRATWCGHPEKNNSRLVDGLEVWKFSYVIQRKFATGIPSIPIAERLWDLSVLFPVTMEQCSFEHRKRPIERVDCEPFV